MLGNVHGRVREGGRRELNRRVRACSHFENACIEALYKFSPTYLFSRLSMIIGNRELGLGKELGLIITILSSANNEI
jgi:hypothetical protein